MSLALADSVFRNDRASLQIRSLEVVLILASFGNFSVINCLTGAIDKYTRVTDGNVVDEFIDLNRIFI